MDIATAIISVIYHAFVAWVAFILIRNFLRCGRWEREVLYIVVLVPFLLRLLQLK
jgi:hypothetical protein